MTSRDVFPRIALGKHLDESSRGVTDFMVRRHRQAEMSKEAENRSCGRFSCGPQCSSFASGRSPTIPLFLAFFPILAGSSLVSSFDFTIGRPRSFLNLSEENHTGYRYNMEIYQYTYFCNILKYFVILYL